MARRKQDAGISPAGKLAILLVLFGIPLVFVAASWGLNKLFDVAPWAAIAAIVVVATIYTAHTSSLLYNYYEASPTPLRFIPSLCETTLIDQKFHLPCYICYAGILVMGGIAFLPYDIAKILGEDFVEMHTFIFGMVAFVFAIALQVVKGIGIVGCINDVATDWHRQVHADVGLIKRFSPLGFIPFVRVIALYSLNKPLDTLVTYMGVSSSDGDEDAEFYEEEEEDD